jgi:hypothetical protein
MELEPEIVLLEALSKWDERVQGVISLERWDLSHLIFKLFSMKISFPWEIFYFALSIESKF